MSTTLETTNNTPVKTSAEAAPRYQRPRYNVDEDANAFAVRVNMPGVNRAGVDISQEEDTLTVTGSQKHSVPDTWRPLRREMTGDDYRLSLRLNVPVNEAEIKARVEDGVLYLSLPKADEVKARKIEVS